MLHVRVCRCDYTSYRVIDREQNTQKAKRRRARRSPSSSSVVRRETLRKSSGAILDAHRKKYSRQGILKDLLIHVRRAERNGRSERGSQRTILRRVVHAVEDGVRLSVSGRFELTTVAAILVEERHGRFAAR